VNNNSLVTNKARENKFVVNNLGTDFKEMNTSPLLRVIYLIILN
jgi:hypothetical protein